MRVNRRAGLAAALLVSLSQLSVAEDEAGLQEYQDNCLMCHQAGGGGVPFMQPALVNSARVLGGADELIDFVLRGTIDRGLDWQSDYNNAMPAFGYLSNAEIASLLSYIRKNFGNEAGAILPSDVERVRAP